eukprot:jgi/Mesvir1/11813/Mv00170-RA.1
MQDISARYRQLTYLKVPGCKDADDGGLAAVSRNCQDRDTLDVSGCPHISDAGIATVAESCIGLLRLAVASCWQVTNGSLVTKHRLRRELLYSDVTRVTDAGMIALMQGCRRLRVFHCPRRGHRRGCVAEIGRKCAEMEHLDVGYCGGVTDASIPALPRNCPRLRVSSVDEWAGVCAAIMCLVARSSGRWRGAAQGDARDGGQGHGVGHAGFRAVAASCHEMRHLNMDARWVPPPSRRRKGRAARWLPTMQAISFLYKLMPGVSERVDFGDDEEFESDGEDVW